MSSILPLQRCYFGRECWSTLFRRRSSWLDLDCKSQSYGLLKSCSASSTDTALLPSCASEDLEEEANICSTNLSGRSVDCSTDTSERYCGVEAHLLWPEQVWIAAVAWTATQVSEQPWMGQRLERWLTWLTRDRRRWACQAQDQRQLRLTILEQRCEPRRSIDPRFFVAQSEAMKYLWMLLGRHSTWVSLVKQISIGWRSQKYSWRWAAQTHFLYSLPTGRMTPWWPGSTEQHLA